MGKNAVQKMEDLKNMTEGKPKPSEPSRGITIKYKELDFRRRLSGVVCKPPYAASNGNFLCGER